MEWSRVAIRKDPPIRTAMRQRKHAMTGLRAISREQRLLGVLTPRAPLGQAGLRLGRQALDAVLLSGTHGAESVMRLELEEIAGPDQYSSDPALQQWSTLCRVARGRRPDGQAL